MIYSYHCPSCKKAMFFRENAGQMGLFPNIKEVVLADGTKPIIGTKVACPWCKEEPDMGKITTVAHESSFNAGEKK